MSEPRTTVDFRTEIARQAREAKRLRQTLPFWLRPSDVPPASDVYASLPTSRNHYRTLVVDPPWNYNDQLTRGRNQEGMLYQGGTRGAIHHYDTLSVEQIAALPVRELAAPDAHLYVWFTNAFAVEAHHLATHWGFTPKTILTWVKTRKGVEEAEEPGDCAFGMGHYLRNTTEHALLAVRGSLKPLNRSTRNVVFAPLRGHSVKPGEFYDLVREVSPGPRIDLFARRRIEGFDAWGNEVEG